MSSPLPSASAMDGLTREQIAEMLLARHPLAAARAAGIAPGTDVTVSHATPGERLVDGDSEGSIDTHRAAHAAGRPSEAAVAYGAGHGTDSVAGRIAELAALARETGLLRAVCPLPGEGTPERPGSWGVEDLTIIAVCRLALPEGVAVRPHWERLGAAACQIAVAFGATEWRIPPGDATDPERLAAGVGAVVRRA